jgi:hypothetical protein
VFGELQTAGCENEYASAKETEMTTNTNSRNSAVASEQPADQIASGAATVATAAPINVAGRKYVPAAGRHSQKKRDQAIARGAALGFTTERELHDYDRAQVLAKLKKTVDVAQAQQRNEASRKTGA